MWDWSSEGTDLRSIKVVFRAWQTVVSKSRMPLRAPLISILLEAQVHCLRYGRLAPRSVHYLSTAESGFKPKLWDDSLLGPDRDGFAGPSDWNMFGESRAIRE